MIESVWMLLRLAAGLGSIEAAGYALLILVLRRGARFNPLERLSFAFGLGSLSLTIWMLLLSFLQMPYSLGTVAVPWLALAALGVWPAWKRGWLQEDCRAVLAGGQSSANLGEQVEFFPVGEGHAAALTVGFWIQFPAGDDLPDLGLGRPIYLGAKSQGLLSGPGAGFEPD